MRVIQRFFASVRSANIKAARSKRYRGYVVDRETLEAVRSCTCHLGHATHLDARRCAGELFAAFWRARRAAKAKTTSLALDALDEQEGGST